MLGGMKVKFAKCINDVCNILYVMFLMFYVDKTNKTGGR